jgi:tetraacyldisaccharide 4'-kinase
MIRQHNSAAPLLRSDHRPTQVLEYPDQATPIASLAGQPVAVLSAIGNPVAFEQTVQQCGATIVDSRRLPDHDAFSPDTVADLQDWIRSLGDRVTRVVCTHKDLVKLKADRIGGRPLAAVLIELELTAGRSNLDAALEEIAAIIADRDS